MIGLGISGVLCALYGSEFAMYAGLTIAILFVLSVVDPGPNRMLRGMK